VALADRRTGIGADTIVILEPPEEEEADVYIRFINADGTEASTCGNATRCVAALLFAEMGQDRVRIATAAGLLDAWASEGGVAVDMGRPKFGWRDIPLSHEADTLALPVELGLPVEAASVHPVGVNMGNPHAVFFVSDADSVDVAAIGPGVEHHALFPERVNVEFATIETPTRIRMRVWERGVGVTQACGSGACATLVAAARRGLSERKAILALDGGELTVDWRADDHVIMTGPAVTSFTGEIDESLLSS
jgi:diaminopimelate epimerase